MIRWTYIERHGGLVHTIPQSSSRCKELRTAAAGSCVLALLHGRPSTFPSWATRRTAEQEVRSTARVEPLHGRLVVAHPWWNAAAYATAYCTPWAWHSLRSEYGPSLPFVGVLWVIGFVLSGALTKRKPASRSGRPCPRRRPT